MVALTKIEFKQPAELIVVTPQATPSDDPSRLAVLQMLFKLMMLIGVNMGTIDQNFAKSQNDQALIAKEQAQNTHQESVAYLNKLSQAVEEQSKAKKWGLIGTIIKDIGIALAAAVGALLCETPAGFALLAGVIALTTTGTLDKATSLLGNAIGSKIVAQLLVVAILTAITAGAEGLYVGASKTASEAGEETAEGVISKFRFNSYAARSVLVTTICSTNLTGELVTLLIEKIPGDEKAKQLAETLLTVIADLAITFAAFKGLSNTASFADQFTAMMPRLKTGLLMMEGMGQLASGAVGTGQGTIQMEQAHIQAELAPLQSDYMESEAMVQVFTALSTLMSKLFQSIVQSKQTLFQANLSGDYGAAAQGMNQYI